MAKAQVRLIVLGALGRMGRAILDAMTQDPSFRLRGAVVREQHSGAALKDKLKTWGEVPVTTAPNRLATKGDVIVDVTRAESVLRHVRWAASVRAPYVLAVTGLQKKDEKEIEKAAKVIPIVVAPNLSVGAAILNEVAWIASALLPEADVEIIEFHHRNKKDSPSGTAKALARSMNRKNVSIHSVRGGDMVGEHRIYLMVNGEQLEFTHVATSRAIFARGALKAARFIVGKKPGIYTMHDVLGLGKIQL